MGSDEAAELITLCGLILNLYSHAELLKGPWCTGEFFIYEKQRLHELANSYYKHTTREKKLYIANKI